MYIPRRPSFPEPEEMERLHDEEDEPPPEIHGERHRPEQGLDNPRVERVRLVEVPIGSTLEGVN